MPAKRKQPLRVAILGQGRSGLDIHCRYLKTAPRKFKIVAIADLLRDRRQRAASEIGCDTYTDYRELLARRAEQLCALQPLVGEPSHSGAPTPGEQPTHASFRPASAGFEPHRGILLLAAMLPSQRTGEALAQPPALAKRAHP